MVGGGGDGGEACGGGACTGSGYNGGLGLSEEPLNGLAIGLVAELTSELEHSGGADYGHADAAAATVDFAMTVLGGRLLDRGGG